MLFGLRRRLPARWLIAGCLLPDLIDKPLYYGLRWAEGHRDALISGSRSIGHSGLLLIAVGVVAAMLRRPAAWALFAGMATHLVLDIAGELVSGADPDTSIWLAVLFPALGWKFPQAHYETFLEHLRLSLESAYVIAGEIVGAAILLRAWLRRRSASNSNSNSN